MGVSTVNSSCIVNQTKKPWRLWKKKHPSIPLLLYPSPDCVCTIWTRDIFMIQWQAKTTNYIYAKRSALFHVILSPLANTRLTHTQTHTDVTQLAQDYDSKKINKNWQQQKKSPCQRNQNPKHSWKPFIIILQKNYQNSLINHITEFCIDSAQRSNLYTQTQTRNNNPHRFLYRVFDEKNNF